MFRYWSDTAAVPPGINRFDLAGGPYGKGGKFESYRPDRPIGLGSRFGPQNMVVCGWGLQALDASPGLWDKSVDRLCEKNPRVGFLDDGTGYKVDGKSEPGAVTVVDRGTTRVQLVSHRDALLVSGTFAGDELRLEVTAGPDRNAPKAVLTVKPGPVTAVENESGERLRFEGFASKKEGDPVTAFEFAIPYTVMKTQGRWANGVELGRYLLHTGGLDVRFVLASTEKQVRAALEQELSGGLRTWEAVFAAKGFIPTGMGASSEWDRFSDSGGYAHLIAAASQYVLWKEGKRDWEVHNVPLVK